MSNLDRHVEASIRRRGLLKAGQGLLVAVSGGLDSMVLLDLLAALADHHGWRLVVAHFNHQLRGRSSDADERFVQRAAERLGLRWVAGRGDVRRHARRHRLSLEMGARKLRHDFLARTARRLKLGTMALAHHADDQIELFFVRVFRGTGGEGLAGMKWRSRSPADSSLEIVRPLLGQPKVALQEYARRHGIEFREDASNASVKIVRNRIRLELLPGMEKRFGASFRKTIPRLMEIVGAEAEFVEEAAVAWLKGLAEGRTKAAFDQLPSAVQRRCLQLQLLWRGLSPDFDLIEQLRLEPGQLVSIGAKRFALRKAEGGLELRAAPAKRLMTRPSDRNLALFELRGRGGKAIFGNVHFDWNIKTIRGARIGKRTADQEFFDAEKLGRRVRLRHWRAGDRFQPIGMSKAVKLQDLFTNLRIPRELRRRLVVAEAGKGELFWVEGLRISERFKLDKATRFRLKWGWKRSAA